MHFGQNVLGQEASERDRSCPKGRGRGPGDLRGHLVQGPRSLHHGTKGEVRERAQGTDQKAAEVSGSPPPLSISASEPPPAALHTQQDAAQPPSFPCCFAQGREGDGGRRKEGGGKGKGSSNQHLPHVGGKLAPLSERAAILCARPDHRTPSPWWGMDWNQRRQRDGG